MVIRANILIWAYVLYLVLFSQLPADANSSLVLKAEQLIEQGKYAKAESIVSSLLKKRPHDTSALYLFGRIKYGQGNTDKASEYFKKAIKADYKNALAHWYLGSIYVSNNQMYDGVDEWRTAIKLRPKIVNSKDCNCKGLEEMFKQYPPRKR
jgi:tetratricopeptide (TPR) repeat protein